MPLNVLEEETSKLAERERERESPRLSWTTKSTWKTTMRGSSLCPTRLGRRTSPTILKEGRGQMTAVKWMHPLQCFGVEADSEMMKCGIDGSARMETDTKRSHMKNYGRDKTAVWWVESFNLPMVLFKVVEEPVVVPQIQYIAVCDGKTSWPKWDCSEIVEDQQNAVQRWGWSMSLSRCIGFSHH